MSVRQLKMKTNEKVLVYVKRFSSSLKLWDKFDYFTKIPSLYRKVNSLSVKQSTDLVFDNENLLELQKKYEKEHAAIQKSILKPLIAVIIFPEMVIYLRFSAVKLY